MYLDVFLGEGCDTGSEGLIPGICLAVKKTFSDSSSCRPLEEKVWKLGSFYFLKICSGSFALNNLDDFSVKKEFISCLIYNSFT